MNETWDRETRENWDYKMSVGLDPIIIPEEEARRIEEEASHISEESLQKLREAGIII